MTDTLRERLAAMRSMTSKYNALLAQHEAIAKYRELPDDSAWPIIRELLNERAWAIAELDRPRLPDGAVVFHPVNSDTIVISRGGHPEDDFLIDPTHALYRFFSAFLPTAGTPMNTETAEKPKPVSLEEMFYREFGIDLAEIGRRSDQVPRMLAWVIRTLDQERGV